MKRDAHDTIVIETTRRQAEVMLDAIANLTAYWSESSPKKAVEVRRTGEVINRALTQEFPDHKKVTEEPQNLTPIDHVLDGHRLTDAFLEGLWGMLAEDEAIAAEQLAHVASRFAVFASDVLEDEDDVAYMWARAKYITNHRTE